MITRFTSIDKLRLYPQYVAKYIYNIKYLLSERKNNEIHKLIEYIRLLDQTKMCVKSLSCGLVNDEILFGSDGVENRKIIKLK